MGAIVPSGGARRRNERVLPESHWRLQPTEACITVAMCMNCERGPSGIEGHERLFSQTFDHDQMRFKCRECNSTWVRRYGENGTYSWALPVGGHPGRDIPGRPGTAPP